MSEDRSDPGQGTSVEYEITDGHLISQTENPTKGDDDLEEVRRDSEETKCRVTSIGRAP